MSKDSSGDLPPIGYKTDAAEVDWSPWVVEQMFKVYGFNHNLDYETAEVTLDERSNLEAMISMQIRRALKDARLIPTTRSGSSRVIPSGMSMSAIPATSHSPSRKLSHGQV
eukprot:gene29171-32392_t